MYEYITGDDLEEDVQVAGQTLVKHLSLNVQLPPWLAASVS
jgi:hypothetical protein